jgi:hypothetical protein
MKTFTLTDDEDAAEVEAALRAYLTPDENARLTIAFGDRGKDPK